MGLRRKARELAVQAMYALDYTESESEYREFTLLNTYPSILQAIAEQEELKPDNPSLPFAEELIRNTIIHLEEIEKRIAAHSDNWSLQRIISLDRNILRVAGYEMLFTDTPAGVIINEAIEIAKKYSSESSGKFINGVLDAVKHELELERQLSG